MGEGGVGGMEHQSVKERHNICGLLLICDIINAAALQC